MRRVTIPLVASLLATLGTGSAGAAGGATAIVSQVRGGVVLLPAPGAPTGPAVRPLGMVAAGAALRLAPGAEVVVLCADDHVLRLSGPTEWQAGPGACAAGHPLAAGMFAHLLPQPGRVRSFQGSLLTEAPSRGDDGTGKVPVLLTPHSPQRSTVLVASPEPEISWMGVHGALAYELVLERGRKRRTARVEAADVDCLPDPRAAPARVCSYAWPWPALTAGQQATLKVTAETADPDWRLREADASRLQLADAKLRAAVDRRLAEIVNDGLPTATGELLRASVYADAGFYNEAAAALVASLDDRPQAAVSVRLADLYLGLGLLRPALNEYGRAESLLPPRIGDDESRAAIYLGLGRLYVRRDEAAAAADYLAKASRLYRRLGWSAEADAADAEARRALRGRS